MNVFTHTTESETPGFHAPRGPRTIVVLGLLALAALTFSYLGAYAISGALAGAGVLETWPADADPRPQWMAWGFGGLLVAFLSFAGLARFFSQRQLRRIDAMAE